MLKTNRLFYSDQAIDNYQTIINYRNAKNKFLQVSFSEVLENKIENNFFQDKIVFIGTTAETIEDIYETPYNYYMQENYAFTYGVEIHATLTSYVIDTALNNRVVIKFIPAFWQYIQLFVLLLISSFGSWYLYTKISFWQFSKITVHIIYSIISFVVILVVGYLLLLFGWWASTVTALILTLSSEVCIYIFIRLDRLKQENLILEQKVNERTLALEEAQRKILSQEKLVLYQKLARYIAHEIRNKTNIIGLNIENSQTELEELQLIIEDNLFLFEEIAESQAQLSSEYTPLSPQEIILNLNNKLSRIQSVNQKVSLIISEIYDRGVGNNDKDTSVVTDVNLNQLLNNLISDAIQICEFKYNNFTLKVERDYGENFREITCNITEVERALDNIISNAVYHLYLKKTNAENYQPKLSISTFDRADSIEIKIRDNGTGIPSENLDKIFQIFWTTKASPEGLGLGLHFAKELIEKQGGKITVASTEGEYTEFTVTL